MIRVHPDLDDNELLRLFERGIARQWTDEVIDWSDADALPGTVREALGAVMTPVYLGEQTAMIGVSTVLPMMLQRGQHEAALYLSTMGLDEARHFKNLHRLYHVLAVQPVAGRRLPEMWRYHARLLQGRDPVHWVWGILISDLFAKQFYGGFWERFPDTLVGRLARRTLQDEARHQAFSDRYLTTILPTVDADGRQRLLVLRDDLFRVMEALGERLRGPMETLQWAPQDFLQTLWDDTETWVARLGLTRKQSESSESGNG
ncbi:MAG: ferritin-like domain-containing protein [Thermaerobacter sp.]|nr:ferritin-like domain-containing protein [Thermaerobacter sp.]